MNDFERFQTIVNQSPQDTEAWLKRLWTLWTLDQYYVKTEGGRWHKRWKKKETINRRKPEAVKKIAGNCQLFIRHVSDHCLTMPVTWLIFSPPEDMDDLPLALLLKISDWFAWVLCAFGNVCRLWQRHRRYAIKQYDACLLPTFDCFDCLTLPALQFQQ